MGDALGGHWVQGHVDSTARVVDRRDLTDHRVLAFSIPPDLAPFLVEKGSVTVDGVSLTVSALLPDRFEVALIPHTLEVTTLSRLVPGDRSTWRWTCSPSTCTACSPPAGSWRRTLRCEPGSGGDRRGQARGPAPRAGPVLDPLRPALLGDAGALLGQPRGRLPGRLEPGRQGGAPPSLQPWRTCRSTTCSTSRPCRPSGPRPATSWPAPGWWTARRS